MGTGAVLLLLCALLGVASSFYGDSVSFMTPRRTKDGAFEVTFYRRQNNRASCQAQSSFTCGSGACSSFDESSVHQTDQDATNQGRWCQSERHIKATVKTNNTFFHLKDSGCCWTTNVEGKTNWTSEAELNLGVRSDSQAINACPVTTTVSSLRVPQNCFSRLRLLAHDPDGDKVKCRFAQHATVPSNFTLDKNSCTLRHTGKIQTGVHVFEVTLEDRHTKNLTLGYADETTVFRDASNTTLDPLCQVKLQFSIEVLPPIPNCEAGHVQPMFLSRTPSHGDILHATVGQRFQLFAEAQAHHSSIHDFQVSGPHNMTKAFKDSTLGKAQVTLTWTPQSSDLYRYVPVCFTAETNETQSEMRCVVVMVTQADIIQGKATVQCSPNKMTVALEKASMPGIDEKFLVLRDPTCSLTANSTHITGTMSFSTCGTKLEDKGDFIVFSNEIESFELPTEVIIRRKTVKIDFSCQFPKAISISNYFTLHRSDYIFTESSFGSFVYAFEIFNDSNFTSKVEASAYPVEIKLLQTIYMGIQASSELPNVTLFVESCKATPDDNPDNPLFYTLISNGCAKDETLKVHSSDQTAFNFEIQAFKFTGNYEQVYITCSVILCEPGSPFSRCAQGCLNDASRRRRRALSGETSSHSITQGPLQFVSSASSSAAKDDDGLGKKENDTSAAVGPPPVSADNESSRAGSEFRTVFSSNITTAVFGSFFLVAVILLAVLIRYYTRRRKTEDHSALIPSEWGN